MSARSPRTAMYSEVPSIDQCRHTHCDDEPRRPSRKQPPQMAGSLSIALDCPPDRFAAIATHSSGQPATRLAPVKSVLSQYGPSGSGGC